MLLLTLVVVVANLFYFGRPLKGRFLLEDTVGAILEACAFFVNSSSTEHYYAKHTAWHTVRTQCHGKNK